MNVHRLLLSELDDDWVDRLDRSSLMASSGFARLWEAEDGCPVVWGAELEGELAAVLPGVEYGIRPVRRFQAMPDGLYARVVCTEAATQQREQVASALASVLARAGYAKLYVTDYFGEVGTATELDAVEQTTTLVNISPSWQPPDAKLRSEIRKAEREGVNVQPFDRKVHMEGFLHLMHETEKRHGRKPRYSDAFFANLAVLAKRDQRVVWRYVEHEGTPATSHIYLCEGTTLLNWQIYFDKQFSFLKANQLTLYSTVIQAVRQGYTKLNLGATPGEAEGVKTYKDKWGGQTYSYPCLTKLSAVGRLL